jgi:glycosyltransferase involved in cell wall biosynthesis
MRLGVPAVLEYEDDAFVDVGGKQEQGWRTRMYLNRVGRVKGAVAGCIGVSPHLLSKVSPDIPSMLLRGVVDQDILRAAAVPMEARAKRVAFSGTHYRSKGLEPLIAAWNMLDLPGWELHIAGRGELTAALEQMAAPNKSIVFHGLLDRVANARFLGAARIGINPHDVSETPGNVFAFKIVEYLAAGQHCITTPMGALEPELEAGTTYMPDNTPRTIAETLKRVVERGEYQRIAAAAAQDTYGPAAISNALHELVTRVGRERRTPGFRLKAEATPST